VLGGGFGGQLAAARTLRRLPHWGFFDPLAREGDDVVNDIPPRSSDQFLGDVVPPECVRADAVAGDVVVDQPRPFEVSHRRQIGELYRGVNPGNTSWHWKEPSFRCGKDGLLPMHDFGAGHPK
jgi:hypothetical protein